MVCCCIQHRPEHCLKQVRKLLEASEMWTWQRMLKISWTEKVTNEELLVLHVENDLVQEA